jgi:hypothetical protein
MRMFFFVLFQIEMLVIAAAAVYVVKSAFGSLKRIEGKVDEMTQAMKRK